MLSPLSAYKGFSAEQFASDEYFQQFILTPDKKSEKFFAEFLRRYPGHHQAFYQAAKLVEEVYAASQGNPGLKTWEKQEIRSNLFHSIGLPEQGRNFQVPQRKLVLKMVSISTAAAVIIALSVILLRPSHPVETGHIITVSTKEGETKQFVLEDSSVVILNGQSSLSYSSDIVSAPERVATLTGNGYFHIKKTSVHTPFTVRAQQLSIRVLGTVFNVNARSVAAEVALVEGSVSVSEENDKQSVNLLPGNKSRWDPGHHVFISGKTDPALYSVWSSSQWTFSNTSLDEVVNLMNAYYGTEAEFKTQSARQLRITAVIPGGKPAMIAKVLEKTLHISMKMENNHLVIQ